MDTGSEQLSLQIVLFDTGMKKVYKLSMQYEFDSQKSELNKTKHGIDFVSAQLLWEDPARVVIPARISDEPRFLLIGRISGRYWSAVFTLREQAIRIISVRPSRKEEVKIYEG
jgi:uncharacterized DUF497 family protein